MYTYCKNDPINFIDPTGHYPSTVSYDPNTYNNDVMTLQNELKSKYGYDLYVDGYFGDRTLEAVRNFQFNHNCYVDGIVGPQTWGAIYGGGGPSPAPTPQPTPTSTASTSHSTLRENPNQYNPEVVTLQQDLNSINPESARIAEDGYFGSNTLNAVTAFQRSVGLDDDGIVGPLTWGKLDSRIAGGGISTNSSQESNGKSQNQKIAGTASSLSEWIGYDHYLVQQYILNYKPNEFEYSMDLVGELPIPNGGRYGVNGSADIVDLMTKEVWEIKSIITKNYEESTGSRASLEQLRKYIDSYPGGGARFGKYISEFCFAKDEKTEIVVGSFEKNRGMLYYWERSRRHEQPSNSYVSEFNLSQISVNNLEKITGLSGAALVLYLIVSEGSRIIPARNLIPIW